MQRLRVICTISARFLHQKPQNPALCALAEAFPREYEWKMAKTKHRTPGATEPLRQRDGTVVLESEKQKRIRYAAQLVGKGHDIYEVRARICTKFGVVMHTATNDTNELGRRAAHALGSDEVVDALIYDAIGKVRKNMGVMFELSKVKPTDFASLDPKYALEAAKLAVSAGREMRQSAETLVNIVGRVNQKWSPKAQLDLGLVGGTDEQQEAVRRLMGETFVRKAIQEKDGADVLDAEYVEVTTPESA